MWDDVEGVEGALEQVMDDSQVCGLIFSASALIDCRSLMWRVWTQVCDCHSELTLTFEEFNSEDFKQPHSSPKDIIKYLVNKNPQGPATDQEEVYLTFVKFHDRALVNFAQGIMRVDAVFAVAKRYHKAIPMAVISMDKHEDVVQLLTIAGALHLFDAVVAQQPGSRRSFSELFCIAAKHINQSSDLCLGLDCSDVNIAILQHDGKKTFNVKELAGYEDPLLSPPVSAIVSKLTTDLMQSKAGNPGAASILVLMGFICYGLYCYFYGHISNDFRP